MGIFSDILNRIRGNKTPTKKSTSQEANKAKETQALIDRVKHFNRQIKKLQEYYPDVVLPREVQNVLKDGKIKRGRVNGFLKQHENFVKNSILKHLGLDERHLKQAKIHDIVFKGPGQNSGEHTVHEFVDPEGKTKRVLQLANLQDTVSSRKGYAPEIRDIVRKHAIIQSGKLGDLPKLIDRAKKFVGDKPQQQGGVIKVGYLPKRQDRQKYITDSTNAINKIIFERLNRSNAPLLKKLGIQSVKLLADSDAEHEIKDGVLHIGGKTSIGKSKKDSLTHNDIIEHLTLMNKRQDVQAAKGKATKKPTQTSNPPTK